MVFQLASPNNSGFFLGQKKKNYLFLQDASDSPQLTISWLDVLKKILHFKIPCKSRTIFKNQKKNASNPEISRYNRKILTSQLVFWRNEKRAQLQNTPIPAMKSRSLFKTNPRFSMYGFFTLDLILMVNVVHFWKWTAFEPKNSPFVEIRKIIFQPSLPSLHDFGFKMLIFRD